MSRVWTPSEHSGRVSLAQWDEVRLRPYTGEILPLRDEDLAYFADKYELNIPLRAAGRIKRSGDGRYVLPIFDPRGQERGVVIRQPWPGAPLKYHGTGPKADTYRSAPGPVQSHYGTSWRGVLVLVEDQLSAIKLAAYGYDSVALLGTPADKIGTYGGQDRVAEINKRARTHDEVIVALDSDATDAAFQFVRKWGSAFRRIRVAILERDLKDTPAGEFAEVLGVG